MPMTQAKTIDVEAKISKCSTEFKDLQDLLCFLLPNWLCFISSEK